MSIWRKHTPLAAAVLAGVVTLAGASSAHALTTSQSEYWIPCDGVTHQLGTLNAAAPGERVTFYSAELGWLLPGTANASGSIGLIWTCDASDIGATWHVTANGNSSGMITEFTVTGTDPYGSPQTPANERTGPHG